MIRYVALSVVLLAGCSSAQYAAPAASYGAPAASSGYAAPDAGYGFDFSEDQMNVVADFAMTAFETIKSK